jgi:hypothetical protein
MTAFITYSWRVIIAMFTTCAGTHYPIYSAYIVERPFIQDVTLSLNFMGDYFRLIINLPSLFTIQLKVDHKLFHPFVGNTYV